MQADELLQFRIGDPDPHGDRHRGRPPLKRGAARQDDTLRPAFRRQPQAIHECRRIVIRDKINPFGPVDEHQLDRVPP